MEGMAEEVYILIALVSHMIGIFHYMYFEREGFVAEVHDKGYMVL